MHQHLACFMYCSTLAPDADLSCVAGIVKKARTFNKEHQITGILIFDGLRFCQYIEGPAEAIESLAERLAQDVRHTHFTVKHAAPLHSARLFDHWSMAYVLVDDAEPLDDMREVHGETALDRLNTLLPMLDVS